MMEIRDLFTRDPVACLPSDTCMKAGEIMEERNCGFVPVISGSTRKVVGVVTDRDIALCLTRTNRPAGRVRVEECMSMDPTVITEAAEVEDAVRLMELAAIHRLPVVDAEGKLVGVLSLKDIALAAGREDVLEHPSELETQVAELIETIAAAPSRR